MTLKTKEDETIAIKGILEKTNYIVLEKGNSVQIINYNEYKKKFGNIVFKIQIEIDIDEDGGIFYTLRESNPSFYFGITLYPYETIEGAKEKVAQYKLYKEERETDEYNRGEGTKGITKGARRELIVAKEEILGIEYYVIMDSHTREYYKADGTYTDRSGCVLYGERENAGRILSILDTIEYQKTQRELCIDDIYYRDCTNEEVKKYCYVYDITTKEYYQQDGSYNGGTNRAKIFKTKEEAKQYINTYNEEKTSEQNKRGI